MTETQNEYREESGAGNHYRTAYHQGLEALLARLQKQSDGLRKQLHKMLLERPEAFRRQIRQSLGWPLTEKREDVPTVKREYVASDETTDIYRMQMEIQPGLWMYGILFLRRSEEALPLVISQHGGFGTPELCSSFFDSANYHDMTRRILRRGVCSARSFLCGMRSCLAIGRMTAEHLTTGLSVWAARSQQLK